VAAGGAGLAAVAVQAGDLAVVLAAALVVLGIAEEVAVPVLLARDEAAPGRLAGTAVVERAACQLAVRAVAGDGVLAAAQRAVQLDFGHGGDATVEARGRLVGPFALLGLDLDHRQAVDGEFLLDLVGAARQRGLAAVGVQEEGGQLLVGRGLVVDGQQAARVVGLARAAIGAQAEPLHAVVVVTGTALEVAVAAVVPECGRAGVERVAQRIDDLVVVTLGDADLVGQALGDRLEAERGQRAGSLVSGVGTVTGRHSAAASQAQAGCAHGAAQDVAAVQARAQHLLEMRVGAGVGILIVEEGVGADVLLQVEPLVA